MKTTEKVILPSDPEAATLRTVAGWVSRDGIFFGENEDLARWHGATHVLCSECGSATAKGFTICESCRDAKEAERFNAMPRAEWDGKALLYSIALDEYFSDPDDVYDDENLEDNADPMLVICERVEPRSLDTDFFCGYLDEDQELPDEILIAMDAFNKVVKGNWDYSWEPGEIALLQTKAATPTAALSTHTEPDGGARF